MPSKKPAKRSPPNPNGKKGNPLSLAPLTPDQALSAFLRISAEDVKKIKADEAKMKGKRKGE